VANIRLDATFDVVVMMFNVLGYQTTAEQIVSTVRHVRDHLLSGGLFIFDFWFGPAVMADPPRTSFSQFPVPGGELLRVSSGEIDPETQICNVDIVAWHLEGDRVVSKVHERHEVRFFFSEELKLLLGSGELELSRLHAFPDLDQPAGMDGWNALGVATA
jgi:hypothetical protein